MACTGKEEPEMTFFDRFRKKKPGKPQDNFHERVGTLEAGMLSAAHQLANKEDDKLFMVLGGEDGVEWFYLMRGQIRSRNELDADSAPCHEKLVTEWQKIRQLYEEHGEPLPNTIRISYDNRSLHFGETPVKDGLDAAEEAQKWQDEERLKLMEAGDEPSFDWNKAYRAKVRYFENREGDVIGAYALGESTDTILPVYPRAAYQGREILHWVLSLVSITDDQYIVRVNYRTAVKLLPKMTGTQIVDDMMYVQGMSLNRMKELAEKCDRLT